MAQRPILVAASMTTLLLLGLAGTARAQTSVEGVAIGDQGYYWNTPAEVWIFPGRLGSIDNRVSLQYGSPSVPTFNLEPIQLAPGGGFVLELSDNFNVGLWLSVHDPGLGGFVSRGIGATGWNQYEGDGSGPGNSTAELEMVDPYDAALGLDAGRKLDLFLAYAMPASVM